MHDDMLQHNFTIEEFESIWDVTMIGIIATGIPPNAFDDELELVIKAEGENIPPKVKIYTLKTEAEGKRTAYTKHQRIAQTPWDTPRRCEQGLARGIFSKKTKSEFYNLFWWYMI